MHNYIPHQMGLSKSQPRNLLMGKGITIPIHKMGAEAGEHILMLNPENAHKLLSSYKKGKGVRIKLSPEEIEETVKSGSGFFKAAKRLFKNPLVKEIGRQTARIGTEAIGESLGSYFKNPKMGAMVGDVLGNASDEAIAKGSVKAGARHLKGTAEQKGKEMAYDSIKKNISKLPENMRPVARELLDEQMMTSGSGVRRKGRPKKGGSIAKVMKQGLRAVIPTATNTLGSALGASFGGPIGGIAGSVIGEKLGERLNKSMGMGMKRGRGRPRKSGGSLASSSSAYKKALSRNFNGLTLTGDTEPNKPVSSFKTNPKVQESSTQMTLSPYQRMDSPAMNPFIPTSYTQMGGTSSGYGGRGLYAASMGRGLFAV